MRRKVYSILLLSNLTILFIPIFITMAVLLQSRSLLTAEVSRSNGAMLNQLQQTLDSQLHDIRLLGLQLTYDQKVLRLVSQAKFDTPEAKLNTINLISTLHSYTVSNGLIDDLYIYLKAPEIAVTTSTMNDADILYQLLHRPDTGMTFEEWHSLMQKTYNGVYLSLNPDAPEEKRRIAYMQSLPIQPGDESPATLVVLLNQDRLRATMANVQLANAGTVLIADPQHHPIQSNGDPKGLSALNPLLESLGGKSGTVTRTQNGERVNISYLSSKETNWNYVSIVPARIYEAQINRLKKWIYASLTLCLMVGGTMVYWLARKNYEPVKNLVDFVSSKVKLNVKEARNEYSILQRFLSENVTFQDEAKRTIYMQQQSLKRHFLARLLKGRVETGSALAQSFASFELDFDTDRFAVLMFQPGEFHSLFSKDNTLDEEKKLQFVYMIVTNITEELVGRSHRVYSTEVDGMIAFLVNVHGAEEQAKEELLQAAQEAQSFIRSKFFIQLSIGISGIHPLWTGIPLCYEEAMEALEYKLVIGPNQIILHERIKRPKDELYYPLDTERQLINYMSVGQYDGAAEIVNQIIMTNMTGGTLSAQLGKLLVFELIGTMLKAVEQIQLSSKDMLVEKSELIKQLTHCETIAEIEEEIYVFLKRVCEYIGQKKRSHNDKMKEEIIAFIDGHLNDCDLSLTSISLAFDMNTSYLSKFFKEQTGETFIDYMNMRRVMLAKKLLTETDATIQDITAKAGFTSSNTFIRVFKRYEGITPGQFRKIP